MKVFKCIVSGVEFFSDAKKIEEVLDEEGNPTGLVKVAAAITSEGGGAIAGVDLEDEEDDVVEKKLDQFWSFPDIENEIMFDSKKDFEEQYWQFFQDGFVKLAKHKKMFANKEDFKAAGGRFKAAKKWVKKNFKSLQFFTTESYVLEVEDHHFDGKFVGDMFAANLAYVLYDQTTGEPTFYFVKDAFEATTF